MKTQRKISFLMAAHNEEKVIDKSLKNLFKIPYSNYEVIIGLDGCTDKTENIVKQYVKKSKKFKYFKLNLRKGKPEMIEHIIHKSKGEIIIIIDADWIYSVKDKKHMKEMIRVFDNPKIGGIAESFPLGYPITKKQKILEIGVTIQAKMWIDYLKSKGKQEGQWILIDKNNFPMLVNVFRRSLYKKNITLGDDFERFLEITNSNKEVLATNNLNLPRMVSIGENYTVKELFIQKQRTAHARKQLNYSLEHKKGFGVDFLKFFLLKSFTLSPKEFIGFYLVNIIFAIATIKSKFSKPITTKEGWKMRISRK